MNASQLIRPRFLKKLAELRPSFSKYRHLVSPRSTSTTKKVRVLCAISGSGHLPFHKRNLIGHRTMSTTVDERALKGFSPAAQYDTHRPSYPAETVDQLLENVRVAGKRGAKIVDLAAGTGKFTELLAKRPEGFEIIAVEPHDEMRGVLEGKKLSRVEVRNGISTKIPVGDGEVDAVIIAQAFHWFASMESLEEIARVIQPHGGLGLTWNIEDYNAPRGHKASSSWEQKMQDFVWSLDDEQPRYRHEKWRQAFEDQLQTGPLALIMSSEPLFALPLGSHEQPWEVWLPKNKVWDRLNTLSQIAVLQGEERERAHKIFTDAINADDVEVNDKGEVAIHGSTYSHWTTKIPQGGASKLFQTQA